MTRNYEQMPELLETGQGITPLIQALEQLSMQEAELKVIGRLDSLIPKEFFHGSISLDRRIANGEITRDEHEASLEVISKCYVPITPGAALRCVDGRGLLGFDANNPADYEIGPQIQGGTVDVAVAKRLTKGVEPGATLEGDVKDEVETPHPASPGAHTSVGNENTCGGCGACMGQEEKIRYYQNDKQLESITGVAAVVYETAGVAAPQNMLATLPHAAADLEGIADTYFAHKPEIIEYMTSLRQDIRNLKQVLEGVHNEGRVILNFDATTTLHSGKVNHLTDGNINAFGLDVAYILEEYPEEAPVLFADALATLMNLTDGSVEVVFRLPKQETRAV
jgi:hypothetical protein